MSLKSLSCMFAARMMHRNTEAYRSAFVPQWAVLRVLARNADLVVGGGEEVVAGAAGRCGVGVWHLVGGCVVALIG